MGANGTWKRSWATPPPPRNLLALPLITPILISLVAGIQLLLPHSQLPDLHCAGHGAAPPCGCGCRCSSQPALGVPPAPRAPPGAAARRSPASAQSLPGSMSALQVADPSLPIGMTEIGTMTSIFPIAYGFRCGRTQPVLWQLGGRPQGGRSRLLNRKTFCCGMPQTAADVLFAHAGAPQTMP